MIPLSVLDLVPVRAGFTSGDALRESVELAQFAERLGYVRYWFAEHHGMASIASSAPEILIEHIASATTRIRVGSGGVMLPNHPPLRIAEVFHTLEALHPGRIDLGMGRAPGTDPATSRALRPFDGEQFPQQVQELLALSRRAFPPDHPFAPVRVVPADVRLPPIWVLASSGATARFAGSLGLGYAFARHFSPNPPGPPVRAYRESFTPSAEFPAPHVIIGVSVICAPTEEEADFLATSTDLAWVRLHQREFSLPLASPEEASRYPYTPQDRLIVDTNRLRHFIGTPIKVATLLRHLVDETGADEIMVTCGIYGTRERFRSYELLTEEWGGAAGR
jgi:luciferase family oxidoreductase group 1